MKKQISILQHILEDITDVKEFTRDIDFDTFVNSSIIRKSVCMSLINIGELAKALPSDYKAQNKEIPWKNISGLRDITAHKYHTLNLDVIWAVANHDIHTLELFVQKELKNIQSSEG
jgi:uncharacterized protein with HEPN domain